MRVSTQHSDAATLVATIVLDQGETAGYLEQVRAALTKEVTVPGFRKGTAPRHLADRELNDTVVRAEALEIALGDSFTKAATQEGWDVQRTSNLKVTRNDAAGLEYSVTVQLWPKVALPNLATISVPRKPVEVTDDEVAEALETVRGLRATFLDKTGPAAMNDRVEVDFDASVGGVPLEGGSSRNHPLVLGGKTFMPGFEEELVGLVPGGEKAFTLQAPADYYEPKIAGKAVDFKVTLRRVQAVLKPEADDAFARTLGHFKDLTELREHLRGGIRREKEAKESARHRLAILDAVIAAGDVPAPEGMVTEELDGMVGRFSADLADRGVQLPLYLAKTGKTEDQLRNEWRDEARRQVRISLALRAFIRERGVAVSPGELEVALSEATGEMTRAGQEANPDSLRAILEERMLRERALAALEKECGGAA